MTAIFGATFPLNPATQAEMAARLSHRAGGIDPVGSRVSSSCVFAAGRYTSTLEGPVCTATAGGLSFAPAPGEACSETGRETLAGRLANAYLSTDLSNLAKIDGEFAGVILDGRRNTVSLIRDRVGTQPLYYTKVGSEFIFASEYKALLAVSDVSRLLDEHALAELHRSKVVPRGRTLFSAIKQVPAGSVVELSAGTATTHQYWEPRLSIDTRMSLDDGGKRLAELLVTATTRRLLDESADVGLALSGGVDSMILLGAAVRAGVRPRTFTIGDSPEDPEIAWAAKIAKYFGTRHTEQVLNTDDLSTDLPFLVWALEDPIARTETLLTLQLCRAGADNSVSHMIRGDGSDGLFGGMSRHQLLALGGKWKPLSRDIWQVYEYTQRGVVPSRPIARIATETILRNYSPPLPLHAVSGAESALVPPEPMDNELLNRVLVSGPHHSLPMLLQKAERPTSVFQMVPTAPFTDKDVMEFAFSVPSHLKHDGRRNKIILRNAANHLISKEFAQRPKYPQRVRETYDFCEKLKGLALRLEIVEALPARGAFDQSCVDELLRLDESTAWAPEHAMRVWTMILTEIWFRTFMDGDGSQPISV